MLQKVEIEGLIAKMDDFGAIMKNITFHTGPDATRFVQKLPKTPKSNFKIWDQYLRDVKVNILEQYISYFLAI